MATDTDSLVSTEWLANHLADEDLIVLDTSRHLPATERDGRAEYLEAHIPGARFLDLGALADPDSGIGKTLPGPRKAAEQLGALGLDRTKRIVLYDDSEVKTSARAWFILRGYGFERAAILDGGLTKWRAEGRRLEGGPDDPSHAAVVSTPFAGRVRSKQHVLDDLGTRAEQVVDARDAGRFTGATVDTVHDLPGGHIPGAKNVFYRDLFAADGTFLPPAKLCNRFEEAGVDLSRKIVTSCGSGVTASVLLFALHLAGIEEVSLYDGSWSEWGADPDTPKETGEA